MRCRNALVQISGLEAGMIDVWTGLECALSAMRRWTHFPLEIQTLRD
jgi:hypothetical protein